ncbi:hypothetical protein K525DRAFT_272580 [Schizophyllum commune Loenen D]|nr:hypothetical protein K525DRAFT_272580 [Schizophyllum commune Loenen D]
MSGQPTANGSKGLRSRKCRQKFPRKPNATASGLLNDLLGIIWSDLTTPCKSVNANGGAPMLSRAH